MVSSTNKTVPSAESTDVNTAMTNTSSPQQQQLAPPNDDDDDTDEVFDVVILGAGWAGLGVGRQLLRKSSSFKFRILEARDYIGGRSRTIATPIHHEIDHSHNNKDECNDSTSNVQQSTTQIELGSQWIHGADWCNPVYRLALQEKMILHYDSRKKCEYGLRAVWCDEETTPSSSSSPEQQSKNSIRVRRMKDQTVDQLERELLLGRNGFLNYLNEYPERQRRAHNNQNNKQSSPPLPVSIQHVLDDFAKGRKLTPQQHGYLMWMVTSGWTQEYAADLEDIDAEFYDHDKEYSGGDVHFGIGQQHAERGTIRGGYSYMIHAYAKPLLQQYTGSSDANNNSHQSSSSSLIQCHAKVTSIDYSQDPVVIEYVDTSTPDHVHRRILARRVVCTLPLGVLQARSIEFSPPLPPTKMDSIDRLGVGLYNKVIMMWHAEDRHCLPWLFPSDHQQDNHQNCCAGICKPHQPSEEEGYATRRLWMERVPLPGQPQGPWTVCYNAHTHQDAMEGHPIMMYFFLAGRMADEIEHLSNDEIQLQAMAALREWFPSKDPIPEPYETVVTRWRQDPYAHGSYSYYQVGSGPNDRKILADPVDDRLYFAGEAVHVNYYATTHGALLSGVDAANAIWKQHVKENRRQWWRLPRLWRGGGSSK